MLAALLLLALLRPADAPAAPARVDPRIFSGRAARARSSFLVVLRDRADLSGAAAIQDRAARRRFVYETLRAHAEVTQVPVRRQLEHAGVPFRRHFLVNMIEVEGDEILARELAANGSVSAIEANGSARLELPSEARETQRAAAVGIEPNIQKVRAPELWDRGFTGQGVVIGIADTGIEWDHPALKNPYRGWDGSAVSHGYNWHDAVHDAVAGNPCGSDAAAPCDDFGHGTSVAGLAIGDDGVGNRIGVAPGARWIGCRNMDQGNGTPARYTECFEWLLAPTDTNGANPRPDLGADVINNSWVCPASEGCTDPQILRAVVENVRAAGVAVVVAAGNNGIACGNIVEAPAIYDASFTIGATDNDDQVTGFSSSGPVTIDGSNRLKPDMSAPGSGVRTAAVMGSYSIVSGTSAAAPHVAGGIALLWSAIPALAGDVDETELVLEASAAHLPSGWQERCAGYGSLDVPNPVFGWGRLDVERAYEWVTPLPSARDVPARPSKPPHTHVVRARP